MAAGLGFKTFTTGEVLTAGDVNGYLMQGINVFASEAARDAAITSPQEGQFAFTKDNNSLWYYTGSAWAASGATGDIEGVTVTSPLTGGGTSGTVTVGILSGTTSNLGAVQLSDSTSSTSTTLAATANAVKTSYDLAAAAIPKSTVTTAGDVIYATGSGAVTRLGIGTAGQVLKVNSGATAPEWGAAASGSMTLLHTITLSTTSHTQSGISQAYKNLYIVGQNIGASTSAAIRIRAAGRTGNYVQSSITGSTVTGLNSDGFDGQSNDVSSSGGSALQFTFYDYAETSSEKLAIGQFVGNNTGSVTFISGSPFNLQTNIASITITTVAGTANLSGTLLIYGVN